MDGMRWDYSETPNPTRCTNCSAAGPGGCVIMPLADGAIYIYIYIHILL